MQHNSPPDAAALIKEVEWLGCEIALMDGRPVIRGNKAVITPDLLDLLKSGREQIIEHLTARGGKREPGHPFPESKAANRLTGRGPCSACHFTIWWRRAGDTTEGWTCSVCHPAPPATATITLDDLAEPQPLKESA